MEVKLNKEQKGFIISVSDKPNEGLYFIDDASLKGSLKNSKVKGRFTTNHHSATMVPVFSYGPYSELFAGIYENTAIFEKMNQALLEKK